MVESNDSEASASPEHQTLLFDGRKLTSQELAPLLYDDLRQMARELFRRESAQVTIQPTVLVHEAYLRLADQKAEGWENRAQFLAVAAVAMRRVLANAARDRKRLKRGGAHQRVTLTGQDPLASEQEIDLVELDEALEELGRVDERYLRIVELRYFAGLTAAEAGRVLGVSRTIVDREWAKARAYLAVRLEDARKGGA